MNLQQLMNGMQQHARSINSLAGGVPDTQARWKPDPESWSILEVIHHLYDEETYDFRTRLDIILHRPEEQWPPIDPPGWVTERAYNEQDPAIVLAAFLTERGKSIQWLRTLESPDWMATCQAPWGPICAGDMLAAWAAHDLLHLRQLVELQWAYTGLIVKPYKTRYAGEW
ncbi:MAG: DinB family protein [Candidatus Promineifilaceae bacterium]|nr:DinB family protein [Candidatus Promineifilaceae bacterium]